MDTKAVWKHDPLMNTWSLWIVRRIGFNDMDIAVRQPDGQIAWEPRNPVVQNTDPPLITLPADLLEDVVLPAAPGALVPASATLEGKNALQEALEVERERVDLVIDELLKKVGR